MKLEGTPTNADLREAFAREAQAALRALFFARRADIEGEAAAAGLLRAVAEGANGHGFGTLEFLEETGDDLAGGGDPRSNLDSVIAGAEADAEAYAGYAATARKAKLSDVADWFDAVATAKRAHVRLLRAARAGLGEPA